MINIPRKSQFKYWCSLVIGLIILVIFPLICWNYASKITLWGDEASSLVRATDNWTWIPDHVHLPTYYWLLNKILNLVDLERELLLRMVHVIPMVIGLIFGILLVRRIFNQPHWLILVSALAVTLPNYIFYGTNIRMYSLLFVTTMMFIDAVSRILESETHPSKLLLFWLFFSSCLSILADYSGAIYYLAGVVFILVRAIVIKSYQPLLAILTPSLLLLYLAYESISNIQAIAQWDIQGSQGLKWQGLMDFVKWLYLACRPALDLIYPASLPTVLALLLPLLWLAWLAYAVVKFFLHSKIASHSSYWLLVIAMLWVPFIPTGYSFTRLFLPSQFLMIVLITWSIFNSTSQIVKFIGTMSLGLLLLINLQQAIHPTLRLYNLIPYEEIARDIIHYSKTQNINRVFMSDRSLNTLSIELYLQQGDHPENINVNRVNTVELMRSIRELETNRFLFVSHLQENNDFVNLEKIVPGQAQLLKGYIALEELPYNRIWKQRILDRGSQPYAIQLYTVSVTSNQ